MAQVAAREMLIGYTNFHNECGAALRQDTVGSQSLEIIKVQLNKALSNLEASPRLSRRLD